MASWNFGNLGASCNKETKLVEEVLECVGVDFSIINESQTGFISEEYRPKFEGSIKNKVKNLLYIYDIVNDLFDDNVFLYYSWEYGNSISDYYNRHEEIYNPITKKIIIVDCEYCYGEQEIFGKNVYKVLKKQIEDEAKKQNISVKWDSNLFPSTDEFADFCDEFIDSLGGLPDLGKKIEEKDIPSNKEVNKTLIKKIADTAGKNGLLELVNAIKEKYGVTPKTIKRKKKLTEAELIKKIKEKPIFLRRLDNDIRNNKEFLLKLIKEDILGFKLEYAGEELRNDKEVVLEAIKRNADSLQYASDKLKMKKKKSLQLKRIVVMYCNMLVKNFEMIKK